MAKLVSWYGYTPTQATAGVPSFSLSTNLLGSQYTTREFPTPTTNFSVSQPGVYFIGIYGAWNGDYGYAPKKPENGVKSKSAPIDEHSGRFQPLAIVTPWENGTRPALPPNFAGPVHVTKAIPGDW